MIFSRSSTHQSPLSVEDIKSRLLGKHMTVHDMDFEVYEKDGSLSIMPHAEHENNIKTLPETKVELHRKGNHTKVQIKSKMRQIDVGGPLLIVIFCIFMLIAASLFFVFGDQEYLSFTYTLLGISIVIFGIFWTRMETGYFDYIRKIKKQVRRETSA